MKSGKISDAEWKSLHTLYISEIYGEEDLKCKGAKFRVIKFKPGTSIKPHFHEKITEVFFILEGQGKFHINGKEIEVKPNDYFLCESNDAHGWSNDGEKDLVALVFRLNQPEGDDVTWV